jgi:hypothetical protein
LSELRRSYGDASETESCDLGQFDRLSPVKLSKIWPDTPGEAPTARRWRSGGIIVCDRIGAATVR